MEVCLLTRNPVLESGGIGRVSIEIRDGLIRSGHKVHTVFAKNLGLAGYFKYTFIDNYFNVPKGYDIYHAITPMESIWLPKEKSIATVLDIIPIVHPELHGARMGGNKVKYTIGKACFTIGCGQTAKCRYIVCISEHVRREFIERFDVDENKVKVIRLGIRSDLNPQTKKDGDGVAVSGHKVFRVGYLGQLDRRKRVDLLVSAFRKGNIDGELVLGGRGIDEDGLKEMAQGDKRIKFVGFVPDDRLVDFYNSIDVFVFPTAIEGYGLPPVEATACKKPVIMLSDAIVPQEVKDHCIVVETLDTVLSNVNNIESLSKYTNIEDNYLWAKSHDWNTTITEYIKLYKEVIND
jgi:glycosyltransferase involved in cell wall biosynthesis